MVSTGDRDQLELPLTLAEFLEALRCMPTNKSPGLDRLTVEFYHVFWDVLVPDLITVWANMDYKVVVKAISLWLGSVLVDVVHPDETYTVLGRTIFDNLYLVLYAGAECLVNWTLTELVSFGRGVQQGCPLSGQLYALAIKPFLCLLCRQLTGLALGEPELRLVLSAYADDVLFMVQDPGDLVQVEACQAIYSAAVVSAFLSSLDPRECLVLCGDFNTTLEEREPLETEQCLAATDVLQ
ncbi:unnamed protein product [Caretta caretta]